MKYHLAKMALLIIMLCILLPMLPFVLLRMLLELLSTSITQFTDWYERKTSFKWLIDLADKNSRYGKVNNMTTDYTDMNKWPAIIITVIITTGVCYYVA